jgi:hypothetical protein
MTTSVAVASPPSTNTAAVQDTQAIAPEPFNSDGSDFIPVTEDVHIAFDCPCLTSVQGKAGNFNGLIQLMVLEEPSGRQLAIFRLHVPGGFTIYQDMITFVDCVTLGATCYPKFCKENGKTKHYSLELPNLDRVNEFLAVAHSLHRAVKALQLTLGASSETVLGSEPVTDVGYFSPQTSNAVNSVDQDVARPAFGPINGTQKDKAHTSTALKLIDTEDAAATNSPVENHCYAGELEGLSISPTEEASGPMAAKAASPTEELAVNTAEDTASERPDLQYFKEIIGLAGPIMQNSRSSQNLSFETMITSFSRILIEQYHDRFYPGRPRPHLEEDVSNLVRSLLPEGKTEDGTPQSPKAGESSEALQIESAINAKLPTQVVPSTPVKQTEGGQSDETEDRSRITYTPEEIKVLQSNSARKPSRLDAATFLPKAGRKKTPENKADRTTKNVKSSAVYDELDATKSDFEDELPISVESIVKQVQQVKHFEAWLFKDNPGARLSPSPFDKTTSATPISEHETMREVAATTPRAVINSTKKTAVVPLKVDPKDSGTFVAVHVTVDDTSPTVQVSEHAFSRADMTSKTLVGPSPAVAAHA